MHINWIPLEVNRFGISFSYGSLPPSQPARFISLLASSRYGIARLCSAFLLSPFSVSMNVVHFLSLSSYQLTRLISCLFAYCQPLSFSAPFFASFCQLTRSFPVRSPSPFPPFFSALLLFPSQLTWFISCFARLGGAPRVCNGSGSMLSARLPAALCGRRGCHQSMEVGH